MYRLTFLLLLISIPLLLLSTSFFTKKIPFISPLGKTIPKEKPLQKYSFTSLRKQKFSSTEITFGTVTKTTSSFISSPFYFHVNGKKVSGMVNIPVKAGTYPILILLRGFVEKEAYHPGIGSQHVGEYLAQNGYITLAPDFLGFGESDNPSQSSIEERFQTYTTVLSLLTSVPTINNALATADVVGVHADSQHIGIWGHSNGGHIALSTLAITGKAYPTVLWAPVSKPFPYSVLFFTDEFDDHGKELRKVIAAFEEDYDIEQFSPPNYYSWISAPIQIHQGQADEAVPQKWSDTLATQLEEKKNLVDYFLYPQEDHNFTKGSWPIAVQRTRIFFDTNLK